MSRTELRLSGFGGQGIILSGVILGKAATLFDKQYATLTQSYGPESRGGYCSAHLVISPTPVLYPLVSQPAVQVLMSQEAYVKYAPESDHNSVILIDEDLVKTKNNPHKGRLFAIPATRIAESLGRRIMANIVMLGFFAAITSVVSVEAVREAVRTSVPEGTEDLNLNAFDQGYSYGRRLVEGARASV